MKKKIIIVVCLLIVALLILLITGIAPPLNKFFKENYTIVIKLILTAILFLVTYTNCKVLLKNDNRQQWFVRYGIVFSAIGFTFFLIGFLKSSILHDFWNFGLACLLIGVACTLYSSLKFTCQFMEGFLPKITATLCFVSIFFLALIIGSRIKLELFFTVSKIILAISSFCAIIVLAKRANN